MCTIKFKVIDDSKTDSETFVNSGYKGHKYNFTGINKKIKKSLFQKYKIII